MPKSVQVITNELDYINDIEKYIEEEEMDRIGIAYKNVAIIGCQSSGKSTLLNILFDTDFEELNQKDRGMAQTTKGIWVARNSDRNILVFDIEGTDSRERGDDRMTFEQTTSLFALAIADVLIINLWTTDVGRHTASNLGLLKVIFEVNLKLFAQDQSQKKLVFVLRDFNKYENTASNLGLLKVIFEVNLKLFAQDQSQKKLVFVLRDFNKYENNEASMKELIQGNIDEIWKQIYKDDKHLNSKASDFFNFEFVMLPHKLYQKQEFEDEGQKLRQRFSPEDINTIFPTSEPQNVPIDGLSVFIENIWKCIRERKELNLPGEKQMVATYRCNEIKEEALEKIGEELKTLENLSVSGVIKDFEDRCRYVLKIAFDYYDESAIQYYKQTYEKTRLDLTSEIMKKLTK